MQIIVSGQDVISNMKYITCESGNFDEFEFVKCKLKTDNADNTVMFLAYQINNIDNEGSI